ncbi:nuclear transport factor 2 family protein [Nocardia sp. NPDC051030]|uniref:nuclear transport factor 2 family protein n=1 Tax=Nocardia sp. NPDC051030 TaxID=3155162 RepID=UPI0034330972
MSNHEALAAELYRALAAGDRTTLTEILHPDFTGQITAGMPLDLGGTYTGADDMRRNFWGTLARHFHARAEPESMHPLVDGGLLVIGRYTGTARTGGELDAAFAHLLRFDGERVIMLRQFTDTLRWARALE